MKLEKKKMATLLAAILIAMAGVMPALAGNTVSLTVTILPEDIISINIVSTVPDPIVLTEKLGAQYPDLATVTIVNDGNVNVDVLAELTAESDAFFLSCLMIKDGVPDPWPGLVRTDVVPNIPFDVSLGLDLLTWAESDVTYTGTLVFWASAS